MLAVSAGVLAGIAARPQTFPCAYARLAVGGSSADAYVRSQLGAAFASLTDAGCLATYASVVAFNTAPAGMTTLDPASATLAQLLGAQALAVTHFCKLTTLLALIGNPLLIPPDAPAGDPVKPSVHFLVWLDSAPLNSASHAQLIIANVLDNAYLLLDPTYAYVLRIPYVGAGPQASLSTVENAATMLQTPITRENLAVLDPAGTAAVPQLQQAVISGALGPQYISHDPTSGSESWDARIAQVFDDLG
jgi:hypothetical protein